MAVLIIEYNRSPKSFRECLLNSESLAPIRLEVAALGYRTELACNGAKLLVHGHQVTAVLLAIQGRELHPRHVIVSADLAAVVEKTIAEATRSRERVIVKTREPLAFLHSMALLGLCSILVYWHDMARLPRERVSQVQFETYLMFAWAARTCTDVRAKLRCLLSRTLPSTLHCLRCAAYHGRCLRRCIAFAAYHGRCLRRCIAFDALHTRTLLTSCL